VVLIGSYQGPPQYALEPGVLSGIPSLHLFGSNDHVIPARKSQHVADLFQEAAVRPLLLIASVSSMTSMTTARH
jgi:predicted esterase